MILVDTSIWIDHLRVGDETLTDLLDSARAMMHAFVLGELACGNLRRRSEVLALLKALPRMAPAHDAEVLYFIERHALMGRGIGYVDAHLLAAVALDGAARLWTRDRRDWVHWPRSWGWRTNLHSLHEAQRTLGVAVILVVDFCDGGYWRLRQVECPVNEHLKHVSR